jgi:O-antigen ligase
LLGYGGASFPVAFPPFERAPLPLDVVWEKAHSTYLGLWLELGLIAGSIPILIVASLGIRAFTGLRDPSSLALSLAAIGAIVAYGTHSLVDFSLEIQANTYVFLAVLALGAAVVRSKSES